jgi:hypothetical protein
MYKLMEEDSKPVKMYRHLDDSIYVYVVVLNLEHRLRKGLLGIPANSKKGLGFVLRVNVKIRKL